LKLRASAHPLAATITLPECHPDSIGIWFAASLVRLPFEAAAFFHSNGRARPQRLNATASARRQVQKVIIFKMCVRANRPPAAPAPEIVAAILSAAAEGDKERIWDLWVGYRYAMRLLADEDEEQSDEQTTRH
jgi:hypothetical protein